jgi:hypothetical protein
LSEVTLVMHRLLVLTLLVACAAPAPQPDDMSAAAHRHEAARERAAARSELEAAREAGPAEATILPSPSGTRGPWSEPHPEAQRQAGSPHLGAALAHGSHAREHEEAAEALEHFEDDACRALAPAARAACPLLHDVVAIVDVEGGVRVRFADPVATDDLVARIQCHLAYARTRGFAGVEDCPLYVRGVRAAAAGPHAIELTAADPAVALRIRTLSRAQALPAP